jgi:uncharacterized membrane protein YdjX (TVP38/TMEM64 family)
MTMPTTDREAPPAAGAATLLRPALTVAVLLGLGLGLRVLLLHHGGLAGLQDVRLPWWEFTALGALVCAVGLPRQAVCFAAAFAYGTGAGLGLAFAANLIACLAVYGLTRGLAGTMRTRWLRPDGRGRRLVARLRARPFVAVLTLRLLPVGSSLLINLASGAAGLRLVPFALATALGSLPQTVIFTLLGGGTRIGHVGQIGLGIGLFVLSGLCGVALLRRNEAGIGPAD